MGMHAKLNKLSQDLLIKKLIFKTLSSTKKKNNKKNTGIFFKWVESEGLLTIMG